MRASLIIPPAIRHALGERLTVERRRYAADFELDAGQVDNRTVSADKINCAGCAKKVSTDPSVRRRRIDKSATPTPRRSKNVRTKGASAPLPLITHALPVLAGEVSGVIFVQTFAVGIGR